MKVKGRPIRFAGAVLIGWVGVRVALLWPQAVALPETIQALLPIAAIPQAAATRRTAVPQPPPKAFPPRPAGNVASHIAAFPTLTPIPPVGARPSIHSPRSAHAALPPPEPHPASALAMPASTAPDRATPPGDRWSASGWMAVRAGSGIGTAPDGGQLGGSQAGLRVAFLFDTRHRIALFARATAPLSGKGREAALGIDWQPTKAPIRIVAEHRIGLDGTKGGPGIAVIAGLDTAAPAGFRLEAYGQTGFILRDRFEPYADGALRATRALARKGKAHIALGVGIWGAAQRDAQRLDAGPSATLSIDTIRISLDWRQRLAGKARPGSGVALTLGGDF